VAHEFPVLVPGWNWWWRWRQWRLLLLLLHPSLLTYLLPLLAHLPAYIFSFLAHFLMLLLHLCVHVCHSVRHLLHYLHLGSNNWISTNWWRIWGIHLCLLLLSKHPSVIWIGR
jgi:hypothetical protein